MRMERVDKSEAYITVKDHKEDFPHKPSFRVINPSKFELGKISKCILDNINKYIIEHIKAIKSYKKQTTRHIFFVFDIERFYPSISLDLFNKALKFAREIKPISDSDLKIMMQSRKTLLFH